MLWLVMGLVVFIFYLLLKMTTGFPCAQPSQEQLTSLLGEAFHPRYMSIMPPSNLKSGQPQMTDVETSDGWRIILSDKLSRQRRHRLPPLAVNSQYGHDETARFIRQVSRRQRTAHADVPWKCETEIEWMDLGHNYFPRYLRQVRCSRPTCWYDFYSCVARAFTVKVLRRVAGECNGPVSWVFHEIAVNFCCECVP